MIKFDIGDTELIDPDSFERAEKKDLKNVKVEGMKLGSKGSGGAGAKNISGGKSALNTLKKAVNQAGHGASKSGGGGRGKGIEAAQKNLQRSAAMMSFVKNAGSWSKMANYLEREAAGGKSYGHDDDDVDMKSKLEEWQQAGDKHLFKLILSPENGHLLDLKEFARKTVEKMEKDLCTKLEYVAINHYDTGHHHTHLVIRGVDQNNRELVLSKEYVKTGVRQRSQEVATEMLGFRRQVDVDIANRKMIDQQRFTELDRSIVFRAKDGIVTYGEIPFSQEQRTKQVNQVDRLQKLESMGLAKKIGHLSWKIEPEMKNMLGVMSQKYDLKKSLYNNRIMASDQNAEVLKTDLKPGEKLTGKLLGTGINDQTGRSFMIIETPGRVHYVVQTKDIESVRGAVKIGDWVAFEGYEYAKKNGQLDQGKPQPGSVKIVEFSQKLTDTLKDRLVIGELLNPSKNNETINTAKDRVNDENKVRFIVANAVKERTPDLIRAGVIQKTNDGKLALTADFQTKDIVIAAQKMGFVVSTMNESKAAIVQVIAKNGINVLARDLKTGECYALVNKSAHPGDVAIYQPSSEKDKPVVFVIKNKDISNLTQEIKVNRIDMILDAKNYKFAPDDLKSQLNERAEVWSRINVDVEKKGWRREGFAVAKTINDNCKLPADIKKDDLEVIIKAQVIGSSGQHTLIKNIESGEFQKISESKYRNGDLISFSNVSGEKAAVYKHEVKDLATSMKVNKLDIYLKNVDSNFVDNKIKMQLLERSEFWKRHDIDTKRRHWMKSANERMVALNLETQKKKQLEFALAEKKLAQKEKGRDIER